MNAKHKPPRSSKKATASCSTRPSAAAAWLQDQFPRRKKPSEYRGFFSPSRQFGRHLLQSIFLVESARVDVVAPAAAASSPGAPPAGRPRPAAVVPGRRGHRAAAATRPEDARLPPVHEDAAGHRHHQAGHEDDDGDEEPHGGGGRGGHALAALREVEDVAGGADAPGGHRADAHAVDRVPLHAAEDAGVAARLVLAEAPAAAGLVVLVGAAVVALNGTVALTTNVLFNLIRGKCTELKTVRMAHILTKPQQNHQ